MRLYKAFSLFAAGGATAATLTLFAAPAAHAQLAYALSNNNTTGAVSLISFNVATPSAVSVIGDLNGATTLLDAIDFRAASTAAGTVLYGYSDLSNTIYTVNLSNGFTTAVATTGTPTPTNNPLAGIDFNPTTGQVGAGQPGTGTSFRIVNDARENQVYNVVSGAQTFAATNLAYASGDVAATAGFLGDVIDNAYTNNLFGATTTQQYGIDYATNSLVTIANNAGTLGTVNNTLGNLGVVIDNTNPFVGFDIFTTLSGVNTAYAVLNANAANPNLATLYTVNLTSGAATPVGNLNRAQVFSLAITPTAAPEPGTLALLAGAGLATVGNVVRRRRAA